MPWCPKCGYEYRPGFDTCSDCGSTLVEEDPKNTSGRETISCRLQSFLCAKLNPLAIVVASIFVNVLFVIGLAFWGLSYFEVYFWVEPSPIGVNAAIGFAYGYLSRKQVSTPFLVISWMLVYFGLFAALKLLPCDYAHYGYYECAIFLTWLTAIPLAGVFGMIVGKSLRANHDRARAIFFCSSRDGVCDIFQNCSRSH